MDEPQQRALPLLNSQLSKGISCIALKGVLQFVQRERSNTKLRSSSGVSLSMCFTKRQLSMLMKLPIINPNTTWMLNRVLNASSLVLIKRHL